MVGEATVCACQDIRSDFSCTETEKNGTMDYLRMDVKDHVHIQSPFMKDGFCEAVMVRVL